MANQIIKQDLSKLHILPNTLKIIYSRLRFSAKTVMTELAKNSFKLPKVYY